MADRPEDLTVDRELLLAIMQDVEMEMSSDLGQCPYLERWIGSEGYGDAVCFRGCQEEPECVTCEPEGGWPSRAPGFDYDAAFVECLAGVIEANPEVVR